MAEMWDKIAGEAECLDCKRLFKVTITVGTSYVVRCPQCGGFGTRLKKEGRDE